MDALSQAAAICSANAVRLILEPAGVGMLSWYAEFRDPDARDLDPDRGNGYGSTPADAIAEAIRTFR